ncbi:uncharacterized protein BKCO1_800038 [Diplodia corticola]|uniref:Subtilisin-like serine protease n=1 Tax=Diplodia corticola TaxID=236234 RepID=A0A1J9RAH6_9PEZI|nr:uncharacterized protein BKCO1_800038 [Diplodia corticola]OJD37170.1 hypothetical protein BKCO1_800038 [Diplodia corticola]
MNSPPFLEERSFRPYPSAGLPLYPPTFGPVTGEKRTRIQDDLQGFFEADLLTPSINIIHKHLWLAGVSQPAHPLHVQLLLKRSILVVENPNSHLLFDAGAICTKPLPSYLLDHAVWTTQLCRNAELHKSACGLLHPYTWLINHESDMRIAKARGLVPNGLAWAAWACIVYDFLDHFDDDANASTLPKRPLLNTHINPRFLYGELHHSRLAAIYRLTLPPPLRLAAALRAHTRVGLATARLQRSAAFQKAAEVMAVLSLVAVAVAVAVLPVVWVVLGLVKVVFMTDVGRRFGGGGRGRGGGRGGRGGRGGGV